jgi:Fe-S cluster assembly protein SufB
VITALEGPIVLTVCSSAEAGTCDLEAHCAIRGNQQVINRAVRVVLEQVTLADLMQSLQLTTIRDTRGKSVPIIWWCERESSMSSDTNKIRELAEREYKWGFTTKIEEERIPRGLSENVVRLIAAKKGEPEFMVDWRLKAYRHWASLEKKQAEPTWANIRYGPIDYQDIVYYSAPRRKQDVKSLDEVDPEILRTYEKLGTPLEEQKLLAGVAVDAVFDRVSVATTFKERLAEAGVIFCSVSEAVQKHPERVRKYLGTVVRYTDNFFASLNAAVFSDGSFVYVPKGVRRPLELSTYFRINAAETGQFERTLIIADEGSYVSYLEGCTDPRSEPIARGRRRADRLGQRANQVLHGSELVSR